MHRISRLINVVKKRKLGVPMGIAIGLVAFLALPFSFSLIYSNAMAWINSHLNGSLQTALTLLMFGLMAATAIALLTWLRSAVAQLFRCRWYRTR